LPWNVKEKAGSRSQVCRATHEIIFAYGGGVVTTEFLRYINEYAKALFVLLAKLTGSCQLSFFFFFCVRAAKFAMESKQIIWGK
jgi:hypothetical protein